jgi:hypothetical protein
MPWMGTNVVDPHQPPLALGWWEDGLALTDEGLVDDDE